MGVGIRQAGSKGQLMIPVKYGFNKVVAIKSYLQPFILAHYEVIFIICITNKKPVIIFEGQYEKLTLKLTSVY